MFDRNKSLDVWQDLPIESVYGGYADFALLKHEPFAPHLSIIFVSTTYPPHETAIRKGALK